MPKILGQDEQQRALKEIRTLLKNMGGTGKFLDAENPEGMYQISFVDPDGNKQTSEMFCASKEDINKFVVEHRKRTAEHILDLCAKNSLALDPEDEVILGLSESV